MKTEINKPSTPSNDGFERNQGEGVTTSSGIRFSMPSWAEKDSPAALPPRAEQAGSSMPYNEQFF